MRSSLLPAVAWLATVILDVLMLWTLVSTDFLRQVGGGAVSLSGAMEAITWAAMFAIAAVTLAYSSVGLLLARTVRGRRIGVVLLVGGLVFAAIPFGYIVGGWLVMMDPADPSASLLFLLGPASIAAGYSLILPVLALLFPDGRLPTRRWCFPSLVAGLLLAGATTISVFRPGEIAGTPSDNPLGVDAMPGWLGDLAHPLAGLGILLVSILGVAAVTVRYRHGGSVERHQLRWFVAAVLLAALPIAMSPQPEGIGGPAWLVLGAIGLMLVPVSVWVAVTRHRLYEIDRLLSRGLAWGVLTAATAAVYATALLVLQGLLAEVTQGGTVAVAASTLLAAALFHPLRQRLQRAMDRRFDRARYDGERIAQALGGRLRNEVELDVLREDLVTTVAEAVRPGGAAVWLRDGVPRPQSNASSLARNEI
jgi:hypothetical protein